MNLLIRTWLLLVILISFNKGLFAGHASAHPASRLPTHYYLTVKDLDSNLNLNGHAKNGKFIVKICSCQILNLKSNNYHQKYMGVFAERSSKGNYSTDLSIAKRTIEKEKRHIKSLFFDELKVVDRFSEPTDCRTLYVRLKLKNSSLVMYDILDADQY